MVFSRAGKGKAEVTFEDRCAYTRMCSAPVLLPHCSPVTLQEPYVPLGPYVPDGLRCEVTATTKCSNTCHQVVPHSHIHLMPFIGRRIIVSPSPSPASCSPPATPSWLSLPINWQPHFCFSSPACQHASYPALGVLDWKGYCSTVPWQVQSSSQFGGGHRSNAGKSVSWHMLQYVLETILLLCHTAWYI